MVGEGMRRRTQYKAHQCNVFQTKNPRSRPMSIWTEEDVWAYIRKYDLDYSPIYDMGYARTGCVFCGFGAHLDKEPNRFQMLAKTHPKLWEYCMEELGLRRVLEYIGVACDPSPQMTMF
jgi:3'-phosphoadenosine 5'-phosphosulfate sulfotransferase (PAPS reductase)/FAD synthetase